MTPDARPTMTTLSRAAISSTIASTYAVYRRWVSVQRSQMVGLSSVACASSRTPSPKRSAAFEMISRSANSYPRVVATVRPISLPRLPAVSEIATILMGHLLPANTSAPAGGATAIGGTHPLYRTPPSPIPLSRTLGRSGPWNLAGSVVAEKDPVQQLASTQNFDYRLGSGKATR